MNNNLEPMPGFELLVTIPAIVESVPLIHIKQSYNLWHVLPNWSNMLVLEYSAKKCLSCVLNYRFLVTLKTGFKDWENNSTEEFSLK